jgi:Leucine-rich repeat (LRR) protein
MHVDHECWTTVASFLPRCERLELMALCSAVAHSPMREEFLEQGTWRLPPTRETVVRLLANDNIKRRIKRLAVSGAWQEDYLPSLSALENVKICYPSAPAFFEFPSRLVGGIKVLSIKCTSILLSSLNVLTPSIEVLELRANELCHADQLRLLPKLTALTLRSVQRGSLLPFASVPNLRSLTVLGSEVRISTLEPLGSLEELHVTSCVVLSLSTLTCVVHQLTALELCDVAFDDPGTPRERSIFIASLERVEGLKIDLMDFLDREALDPLSQLAGLKELQLGFDFEDDLSSLASLTQLEQLSVVASPYADWSPIANMKKLRALTQNGNYNDWSESSARALQSLPALRDLCHPFSLAHQYPLEHLHTLEVRPDWGQTVRFDPGCCPNVHTLTISGRVDLGNLVGAFPCLKSLDLLVITKCESFDSLRALTQLEHLSLPPDYGRDDDDAIYRGFAFLSGMTRMESLHMKYVPIDDLSVLTVMPRLRLLDLSRSRVQDLTPIAGLLRLRSLFLGGTNVKDVSCLRGHPSLRKLHLPAGADTTTLKSTSGFALPNLVHFEQDNE